VRPSGRPLGSVLPFPSGWLLLLSLQGLPGTRLPPLIGCPRRPVTTGLGISATNLLRRELRFKRLAVVDRPPSP
jgi:hypothetical protein